MPVKETLPLRQLGEVYSVSTGLLSRYQRRGAPIDQPEEFSRWLQQRSERLGPLLALLLDGETCRELERTIRSLSDQTKFDTHR